MSDTTPQAAVQSNLRVRQRMKAAVYEQYGPPDVLAVREVEKPTPKDNEVLIKIHATTVTAGDWRARSLQVPVGFGLISCLVFGVSKPRQPILGTELAGEIEAVGKDVRTFKVGDQVFAFSGAGMGCHAQYKCMPEDRAVALKPPNLTYDEAAALSFGGTTALDFFRRGKLQRGERVLVNGASGGVGTAAVQLARHFGADVTGVCSSANVEMVRSLGATHVIDYTKEDFTQNGETYDVIVDTVGTAPFSRSKDSLAEGGRLLLVLGGLPDMLQIPWVPLTSSKKVIAGPAAERVDDLRLLAELAQAGIYRPVIDRCYPLEQIAEAHRYVDSGRKKGNVIITLKHDD
jgi:NADPH:quinone reductase-like Zn-dependent oxidoreductase